MGTLQEWLNDLYPASFNGISFLLESDSTQTGKLTTTHLYPFKNYSYTEELGQKLRSFTVKAIVAGDNYTINRDALMTVLNAKGTGILIHPFYGMITATCTGFTVSHETRELGISRFDITFEESLQGVFPASAGSTISIISGLVIDLISFLNSNFSSTYKVDYPKNLNDSANKCIVFNKTLLNNIATAGNIDNESLDIFKSNSDSFIANLYANIQVPSDLGDAITNLIDDFNNISTDFTQSYNLCAKIFEFGRDDYYFPYTTIASNELIANAQVINDTINSSLLIYMYENASMITYADTGQLEYIENDLENRYRWLVTHNNLPSLLLREIEKLRISTVQYFNYLRVNIDQIIQQQVTFAPLSVLLYKYYENFDYENEIIRLNSLKDVTGIEGSALMVTNQQGVGANA